MDLRGHSSVEPFCKHHDFTNHSDGVDREEGLSGDFEEERVDGGF